MDPFVGEIRMFAGTFAPRGWALCDGQLLAVSGNDALFSLLGTIYGGDGRTTFGLPDLRGRIPIHYSSTRPLGNKAGAETVSLTETTIPSHTHVWRASDGGPQNDSPIGAGLAKPTNNIYHAPPFANVVGLKTEMVGLAGQSSAHDNVMPFQCINFIIALVGIYPSRN